MAFLAPSKSVVQRQVRGPDKPANRKSFKTQKSMSKEAKQDAVFAKPKARRSNIRKKVSNDDDEDDGEDVSKMIEETRTFQKYRAR